MTTKYSVKTFHVSFNSQTRCAKNESEQASPHAYIKCVLCVGLEQSTTLCISQSDSSRQNVVIFDVEVSFYLRFCSCSESMECHGRSCINKII